MELYGLHDKDGKEVKLTVEDAKYNLVGYGERLISVVKVKPITPEPKFKVGDWVIAINSNRSDCIFRISEVGARTLQGTDYRHTQFPNYRNWEFNSVRLATKDEIEAHLREIADEKYGIGIRFRSLNDNEYGEVREVQPWRDNKDIKWRYIPESDKLFCDNGMGSGHHFCSNPSIYISGKWAEIVPSKKKLPQTKEELIKTLTEYFGQFNITRHPNYDKFLDQYED